MKYLIILFSSYVFLTISILEGVFSLPGRIDNPQIYEIEMGKAKMFFYMTSKKDQLTREFIEHLNEDVTFGIVNAPSYFPAPEIIPFSTLYRTPIGEDINGDPLFLDHKGTHLFRGYMENLTKEVENFLQVHIRRPFSGQNLVLNFDANRFHQDDVIDLYKYLETIPPSNERYYIVQDLTLMDWQMAEDTFSSTIFQDPESEDRFVFPIFPKEVLGIFFAEPVADLEAYGHTDKYPTSLPYHTIVAPMDWKSCKSVGSGKGKRTSVVVRGLSGYEEINQLECRSQKLHLYHPEYIDSSNTTYPNGMKLKKIPDDWNLQIAIDQIISFKEVGGIEIFQTDPKDNIELIEKLESLFNIRCPIDSVQVKHMIKRNKGFSALSCKSLDIPSNSIIICLNESHLPPGYGFYNIAQDYTQNDLPWIHLYHLPSTKALLLSSDCFDKLSLTPIEEIMFRDLTVDTLNASAPCLREKITTKIVIFAFPQNFDPN